MNMRIFTINLYKTKHSIVKVLCCIVPDMTTTRPTLQAFAYAVVEPEMLNFDEFESILGFHVTSQAKYHYPYMGVRHVGVPQRVKFIEIVGQNIQF